MADSKPIRVMVVDDHIMLRRGLAAFLKVFDDLELVGEAGSGEEAVRLVTTLQPDVVLMDLVMGGMDGAAATRAIRQSCPQVQVIALTSFREEMLVQKALQAGAISYLLKMSLPPISQLPSAQRTRGGLLWRPRWPRR